MDVVLKSNAFWSLFANLLTAHLLSDFYLQSDKWVGEKSLSARTTWYHFIVVFFTSAIASFDMRFLPYAFLLTVFHIHIECVKSNVKKHLLQFIYDQLMHILSIVFVSFLFVNGSHWEQIRFVPSNYSLTLPYFVCAILTCMTPSNYLVRAALEYFDFNEKEEVEKRCSDGVGSAPSAMASHYSPLSIRPNHSSGTLIGSMERTLIFLFVLMDEASAAGLIVAAKTLLHFRDSEGARAKLVVAGTLLSVTLAIVYAMLFKFFLLGKI